MDANINQFTLVFISSFSISFLFTFIVKKLAIRYGFVDFPSRPHPAILHNKPIARAGGIAVFIGFFVTALFFAQKDALLLGIIMGSIINVVTGTLDDKYNISPVFRLVIQLFTAILVVFAGAQFYMTNPISGEILFFNQFSAEILNGFSVTFPADLILIFWIILLMNTANWTKGASQLPGVSFIAFLTIAGVALKYQTGNPYQLQTTILAISMAGAILAFVPFNFPPEKMFPGFGASTLIGFNLAVLSVLSGGKIATVLIVFALPIIDAVLVGIKRILNRKNPLIHDREHLYHFLLDAGLSKRHIIYLYWGTALILGITVILLETWGKIIVFACLTTLISAIFLYLYLRKQKVSHKQ